MKSLKFWLLLLMIFIFSSFRGELLELTVDEGDQIVLFAVRNEGFFLEDIVYEFVYVCSKLVILSFFWEWVTLR